MRITKALLEKGPVEIAPGIQIEYMGLIEQGKNYKWTEGYSVIVNGNPLYPWTILRTAVKLAKEIAAENK